MKQESSLYAERKISEGGESLFEHFVFDDEYFRKFRELFFDAQAVVIDRYGAYMQYVTDTVETYLFEEADFSIDRDFVFSLLMPDDYNLFYNKQVSIKTREFLLSYIMYRWLETKSTQEAALYKARGDNSLMDARAYLEKRIARSRTGGNFF
ncbi:MAG: hypothetical protein JJE08_06830 [Proteiniphilum sp.]|nr:hypothetical protein [Proteiniphilum sp.]